jgi:hypothetical protein
VRKPCNFRPNYGQMKCAWLFLLFLLSFYRMGISQTEMEFDNKGDVIDLGDIVKTGGSGRYEIWFKNSGRTPLIIERASTGDGGTMADYSREPVAPGQKGKIAFIYTRDYAGPRTRSMTITASGETGQFMKSITVKYRIVYPPTTVSLEPAVLETRKLAFGETDTLTFTLTNTGTATLYLQTAFYDVNRSIIVQKATKKGEAENDSYDPVTCEPGEQLEVMFVVLNIFGNTDQITQHVHMDYNIGQSFMVPLIIDGSSASPTETRIEHNRMLYFTGGELTRIEEFNTRGKNTGTIYFRNGHCTKKISYDYLSTTTVLYKDDQEISRTSFRTGPQE